MKKLRNIWKRLCELVGSAEGPSGGIDTHKWENKMEILRQFSGGR